MLTASGLAKSHGDRTLFADVTMTLGPGRRIALVGANGTGKTTLLEILVGVGEADEGDVHVAAGATIGYLPQDLPGEQGGSVLEEVLAGRAELADLAHRLPRLTDALESATGEEHDRLIHELGETQSRFEQLGGYAREADAHQILAGLGFATRDANRPVDELSGGWRMRVSLARLLVAEPDLLVLDEPTNHLDVDSVAWLEQYLANWSGALLFVSHDRDFIDAVANRVVELAGGRATEYVGGFAEFVAEREERFARAEAAAANQAKRVAQVERFVERFRYKATKARQVQSRVKALERLEQIEVPTREELRLRFAYPPPRRASRVVAELSDVSAGYDGEPVLRDVDIVLERGRKVALVGPNGAGKTTLLRLLTGDLEPLEGSVSLGGNVDIAHFVQHQAEVLDPAKTVLEEFRTVFSESTKVGGKVRNPRTVLGSFGFPGDAADRRVAELSGGEATRLALAKALAEPVNLLVLDEPTNHLDLSSCDLLEDALVAYPSTVLLVTHDRHLIRNVADALVTVRDGTARWHEGVDEALLAPPGATTRRDRPARPAAKKAAAKKAAKNAAAKSDAGPTDTKRVEAEQRNRRHRATRDVQRALQRAERDWETAESEVAELQRALADPALYEDNDKVTELIAHYDQAKDRADRAMATWETKAAELAAIEAKLADADG